MIIDGQQIASSLRNNIQQRIASIEDRAPGLTFILIGNDAASHTYVRMKKKACMEVGILSTVHTLEENTAEQQLLQVIQQANQDPCVDGILVQMPLPAHINTKKVMMSIDPTKDVDGFHPLNMGRLLLGDDTGFVPCTPQGIQYLLHHAGITIEQQHVVILGRSNIVGKPLAALLVQKKTDCNATVTIAHSATKNISSITRSADILVAAIGSPGFITQDMVTKNTVVIDVGINRVNQKIVGDVDFATVQHVASAITPVPGGVGPMTIAMLLQNTVTSYLRRLHYS